jgi:hypothetical protein
MWYCTLRTKLAKIMSMSISAANLRSAASFSETAGSEVAAFGRLTPLRSPCPRPLAQPPLLRHQECACGSLVR